MYPAEAAKLGQAPSGSSVASGTMTANTVTFTGLSAGREYVAYALVSGQHRYSTVSNASDAPNQFGVEARVDELESRADSVESESGRVGAIIAGTPSDAAFLAALGRAAANGDTVLDSTNGYVYTRVGGAWKYVPLNAAGTTPTGAAVVIAGAVTDTNFLATVGRAAADGDRALDSSNTRWYVRVAGAWQYAALSSPAAFTPASISGLWAWYDASQITGKVDGDSISQWDDLSSNSRHAVQATSGKQPTYQAAEQNGKAVVRFDGTDDLLVATPASTLAQPFTVVLVGRTGKAASANETFVSGDASVFVDATTSLVYRVMGGTPFSAFSIGTKESAFKLITAVFNNGGTSKLRVNGTEQTGTIGTVGLPHLNLGASGPSGSATQFLQGDLAEVIVYSKALDATEIGQIEAYLA